MRLWRFNKRIGVVGLYSSGKTVFLTSLINHLMRHDPARFPLGNGRTVLRNFRRLPADEGWAEFAYDQHRARLRQEHRWPAKTRGQSLFRCQFTRDDWPRTLVNLALADLPGERLPDLTMAGLDYAQWSDAMWTLLADGPQYHRHCPEYLELCRAGTTPEPARLLAAYRLGLARCFLAYLPVVCPSSLVLTPQGDYLERGEPEWIAAHRWVGLDPGRQFAPLPPAARRAWPGLAAAFAGHYQAYRRQEVTPLAEWLAECHELVVLVDITNLLAAGLGAYHGAQHMVERLLDWIQPGRGLWGQMFNLLLKPLSAGWLGLAGVTRVALVAGKADKVAPADRQRLVNLLRQMVGPHLAGRQEDQKLRVEYFACAAVKSTHGLGQLELEGEPLHDPGKGPCQFTPSRVPEIWPDDWAPGRYRFPDVFPQMPARRDLPPQQLGLHRVADFMLADDHWTE